MKTIATLLAALATASALFAAPAVQAADNRERVNPHAALPFYGYDHIREANWAAAPAKAAEGVAGRKADSVKRVNPFATLPYYGADHQR